MSAEHMVSNERPELRLLVNTDGIRNDSPAGLHAATGQAAHDLVAPDSSRTSLASTSDRRSRRGRDRRRQPRHRGRREREAGATSALNCAHGRTGRGRGARHGTPGTGRASGAPGSTSPTASTSNYSFKNNLYSSPTTTPGSGEFMSRDMCHGPVHLPRNLL